VELTYKVHQRKKKPVKKKRVKIIFLILILRYLKLYFLKILKNFLIGDGIEDDEDGASDENF